MPRKQRRQLTPQELTKLEAYSALRLPIHQIADLLKISKTELLYATKRYPEVRRAIDIGRSQASHNIRVTLFEMANGKRNKDGSYKRKPDFQALRFWCLTQEGFRYENSDPPVNTIQVNSAEQSGQLQGSHGPQVVITLPSNGRESLDDDKN